MRVVGSEVELPSFSLSLYWAWDGSRSVVAGESRVMVIVSASLNFWVLGLLEGWEMEADGESLSQLRMVEEIEMKTGWTLYACVSLCCCWRKVRAREERVDVLAREDCATETRQIHSLVDKGGKGDGPPHFSLARPRRQRKAIIWEERRLITWPFFRFFVSSNLE